MGSVPWDGVTETLANFWGSKNKYLEATGEWIGGTKYIDQPESGIVSFVEDTNSVQDSRENFD